MEFDELTEGEREALVAAAVWYVKYHGPIIAGLADDRSAMAIAQRERFEELHDGLAKLGIRLARPAGLRPAA